MHFVITKYAARSKALHCHSEGNPYLSKALGSAMRNCSPLASIVTGPISKAQKMKKAASVIRRDLHDADLTPERNGCSDVAQMQESFMGASIAAAVTLRACHLTTFRQDDLARGNERT